MQTEKKVQFLLNFLHLKVTEAVILMSLKKNQIVDLINPNWFLGKD